MADEQDAGSIYFDVELETAQLLTGAQKVDAVMDEISSSANRTGRSIDALSKDTKSAASSLSEMTGYAKTMDGSMQTLNTSVSAMAMAINQANASSANASMTMTQLNASMNTLVSIATSMAQAMKSAGNSTATATNEYSRAGSVIEGLGNQIAILDEAQENGARSAAILAAQLRAGSTASDAEKETIGTLTGRLFDLKNSTDSGTKSHTNWRSSMQQAGYQVQDFIVQVQGGQSALVAFSQQGSQLAGAFGPSGAIVGALIALGSVIVGTLIKSMGDAEDQMKTLATATNALDQVINISQSGVAALSDKYALLARTNSEAATILRNQALIEYNQAISKLPDAISSTTKSLFDFGDAVKASFSGGVVSLQLFSDTLEVAQIKTSNFDEAFSQLSASGAATQGVMSTFINTVGALSSKFGITDQQAFELAKQLDNVSKNKSPEALQALVLQLQSMKSSTTDGQEALTAFVGKLADLVKESANAKANVAALKGEMDGLTAGQKSLIQQSQRDLALSKLQGAARARLQALYKAEDVGLSGDSPQAMQMQNEAEQAYKNSDAQKNLAKSSKTLATQQQSVTQKLQQLSQQSETAQQAASDMVASYDSLAQGLSAYNRELAIQKAANSLGKGATAQQIAEAKQLAAAQFDAEQKVKDLKDAIAADPKREENTSFNDSMAQLQRQLDVGIVNQQVYNARSEKLAVDHAMKLSQINAQQVITPQQTAVGQVDPVQQLANENAQKLALIQQYTQQKILTEQQGLALMNAANTQYEQQRIAAQWEIYRNQSAANSLLADAVDSLQGGASNAITGLLNGTQSLSEAFSNIGSTILNSVVSGLVEMGLQYVKNMMMGQVAATAALGATAAQATAAAGMWAPAAVSASIATMGSASTVGTTAYSTALLASKGMAVAGARKNGGPVSADSMYRVGEGGKPEIFKASNGSQYMIPGDNGSVISNKDIGGSGSSGGMIQQINNFTFQNASGDQQQVATTFAKIAYEQSLRAIRDQKRPGGMLTK